MSPSELSTSSELGTNEKINYELKNVQNVLGVLFIIILKFRNNRFYKNFYCKNCRILHLFRHIVWVFIEGKINIDNTSENLKCGNL